MHQGRKIAAEKKDMDRKRENGQILICDNRYARGNRERAFETSLSLSTYKARQIERRADAILIYKALFIRKSLFTCAKFTRDAELFVNGKIT